MSNVIDSIQLSGVTYTIQGSGGGGIPESAFTAYTASTDSRIAEDEEVTAAGLNALNAAISGISGNNVVELTQAQYDALVTGGTVDPSAFYIITDATAGDLTQYWTSAQTQSAITSAVSGKQDTLVSGTNIKTINNESILGSGNIDIQGGGGKAIEAGRGIAITTGETADTINCTLPISKGSGSNNSLILGTGNGNTASGQYSIAVGGRNNSSSKYCSLVGGNENKVSNDFETAFGNSNVTNYASTKFGDSGNTLFSVGNGPNYNSRHNAFEIRQDGSIYIPDLSNGTNYRDRPMIKLQDALGGGGASYSAGTGIDITNDVISVSGVVMSSAVTSAVTSGSTDVVTSGGVYDQLGGMKIVKLTESEYTALVTKDDNTLYVVIPDPSN